MARNIVECIHWDPEVDPVLQASNQKRKRSRIIVLAGLAAVVLVVCLFLFTPLGGRSEPGEPGEFVFTTQAPTTLPSETLTPPPFEHHTPPTMPHTPDNDLDRGIALFNAGQYAAAIAQLEQAMRTEPDSITEAYIYRGLSFYNLESFHAAIGDFTNAHRRAPNDADILALRGGSFYRAGWYPEAIDDLTRAIELDPSNADAFDYRARTYETMGEHARAITDRNVANALRQQQQTDQATGGTS